MTFLYLVNQLSNLQKFKSLLMIFIYSLTHSLTLKGGRDCQAEDWKAHKTICKQQQMQSKKLETTINEQLSNLTL